MSNKKNTMYKYVCRLTSIKRFAALKLDREYSTADHSYRVAMLSQFIVDDYNERNPDKKINAEEVLRKALIHDLEESFIGDIPTPAKKMNQDFSEAYERLAQRVMKEEILLNCPTPEKYFDLWKNQKDGETGEIIKLADTLEALCTTFYELKRGNVVVSKAHKKFIEWFQSEIGQKLLNKYPLAQEVFNVNQFNPNYLLNNLKSLVDKKSSDDDEAA
jgi:5'-deoxynucleotidase YfbR-like HD superfamily hydrolase